MLRDVLGFPTAEVAGMLGTTHDRRQRRPAARPRRARPRPRRAGAPRPGRPASSDLARRFADAFSAADVDGLVALLTDDAWLAMPPAPHEYHGIEAIAAFLRATFASGRPPAAAAAHPRQHPAGVRQLPRSAPERSPPPAGLFVLTLTGDRIHAITRFHIDALCPRFGSRVLPAPAGPSPGASASDVPGARRHPGGPSAAEGGGRLLEGGVGDGGDGPPAEEAVERPRRSGRAVAATPASRQASRRRPRPRRARTSCGGRSPTSAGGSRRRGRAAQRGGVGGRAARAAEVREPMNQSHAGRGQQVALGEVAPGARLLDGSWSQHRVDEQLVRQRGPALSRVPAVP